MREIYKNWKRLHTEWGLEGEVVKGFWGSRELRNSGVPLLWQWTLRARKALGKCCRGTIWTTCSQGLNAASCGQTRLRSLPETGFLWNLRFKTHKLVVDSLVVVCLIVVKPHFSQSDRVPLEHVDSGPPFVRWALTEDVADMRARNNFKSASAHPDFKREFQILSSPDIESWIIGSKLFEVLLINREQSSSHCRWPDRIDGTGAVFAVTLRDRVPIELKTPVETTDTSEISLGVMVFESVVVDDVDDWAHDGRRIPFDSVEQRFDPSLHALAMRIQIGEDLSGGNGCSAETSSD